VTHASAISGRGEKDLDLRTGGITVGAKEYSSTGAKRSESFCLPVDFFARHHWKSAPQADAPWDALDEDSRLLHAPTLKASRPQHHTMSFTINDRCTGCSACALVCPTGAIRGDHQGLHVIDPARCIDCGACGVTCPAEAVLDHLGAVFSLHEAPMGTFAWVDLAACTGCGWCQTVCLWDAVAPAFVRTADGQLRVAAVDEAGCIACGACELECHAGAIAVLRPSDPRVALWRARNERFLREAAPGETSPRHPDVV
jgi:NAD-dependent dihydropyrimidine dehydrogenase PreA subunit